jgi:hypothetical protein
LYRDFLEKLFLKFLTSGAEKNVCKSSSDMTKEEISRKNLSREEMRYNL